MADRVIRVVLTGENGSLRGVLRSSAAEVKTFGSQVAATAADTSVHTGFIGKAMLGMSAVIIGAFAASAYGAIQFEQSLRNVATISPYVAKNVDDVGARLIRMSTELPQSANTLAKGLYDVASSGFAGRDGLHVLEVSARAASAGLTDTATSARVITGVLNAYGLTARDAADVSDVLFQTVNLGVVTYEELANSLGQVTAFAAAAKIPLVDLGAAYATITLSGIDAAQSGTALKRVIQSFIDPSKALNNVLLQLGYTSGEQAIKQDGLRVVLEKVRGAVGNSTLAFTGLFPEIRAATGALALTSNEGRTWDRIARQMATSTDGVGATQRALAQQQQSLGYQLDLTKNRVIALGLGLGHALLPALKTLNGALQTVLGGFSQLPGGVQTAIVVMAGIAAILLAVGGAFLLLVPRIAATRDALVSMGVASESLNTLAVGAAKFAAVSSALVIGAISFAQIGKNTEATTAGMIGLTLAGAQLGFVFGGPMGAAVGAAGGALIGFAKDAFTATSAAQDFREEINQLLKIATAGRPAGATAKSFLEQQFGSTAFKSTFTSIKGQYDEVNLLGEQLEKIAEKSPASAQKVAEGFAKLRTETGKPLFTPDAIATLSEYLDKGTAKFQRLAEAKRQQQAVDEKVASGEFTTRQAIASVAAEADDASGSISQLTTRQKDLQKTLSAATDPSDAYAASIKIRSDQIKSSLQAEADAEKAATGVVSAETQAQIDSLDNASGAWYDFTAAATSSLDTFVTELEKQNTATLQWESNLGIVATRGGRDFAEALAKMGPEAASLVAQIATSSDPEFERVKGDFALQGQLTGDAATKAIDDALNKPGAIDFSNWTAGIQRVSDLSHPALQTLTQDATDFNNSAQGVTQALQSGAISADVATVSLGPLADGFIRTAQQAGLSGQAAVQYALALFGIPPERATDIHNSGDLARVIVENYLSKLLQTNTSTNANINAIDNATPILDGVLAKMAAIRGGATGSITVREQIIAAGGDPARGYAVGGVEDHSAQVATPGRNVRVWAEPETGGESYIPWATAKRKRATMVLGITAQAFGYDLVPLGGMRFAAGGTSYIPRVQIAGAGANTGGVVVQTEINFNAPVYGENSMRQIAHDVADQRDRDLRIKLRQSRGTN